MLIPESGKPADINLSHIKTVSDCDRVLLWLASVLKDMDKQVKDKIGAVGEEHQIWLKRLRAAERNTSNLRHRVLELRDTITCNSSVHEAIVATLFKIGQEDFIDDLRGQMEQDFPQLANFDLEALRT